MKLVFERLQDFRLQLYQFDEDPSIQLFLHNKIVKSPEELQAIANTLGEEPEGGSQVFSPSIHTLTCLLFNVI